MLGIKMITALLLGGFGAFLVYQGKTEAGMAAAGAAATVATIRQDSTTDDKDDREKLRRERGIDRERVTFATSINTQADFLGLPINPFK